MAISFVVGSQIRFLQNLIFCPKVYPVLAGILVGLWLIILVFLCLLWLPWYSISLLCTFWIEDPVFWLQNLAIGCFWGEHFTGLPWLLPNPFFIFPEISVPSDQSLSCCLLPCWPNTLLGLLWVFLIKVKLIWACSSDMSILELSSLRIALESPLYP